MSLANLNPTKIVCQLLDMSCDFGFFISRVFFPVRWEWGRVPCNWENSAVFVQFGKRIKKYELYKLRKFTLKQHFIQTSVNQYSSSDLVYRNLCIAHSIFVLKVFNFGSLQQIGKFWPHFGKKTYYLALGLGPYNGPKFTRKNPCHATCMSARS